MPDMKGITVKIPADLHAELKAYIEAHGMTTGEFIALAVDNELHPKIQIKEEQPMENMRTLAFQVPESLFQRVKAYLERNHMTQKQFVIGLIEDELEQDEAQYQAEHPEDQEDEEESDEQTEGENQDQLEEQYAAQDDIASVADNQIYSPKDDQTEEIWEEETQKNEESWDGETSNEESENENEQAYQPSIAW